MRRLGPGKSCFPPVACGLALGLHKAQVFRLIKVADGYYEIVNPHSDKALDVRDVSYAAGAPLQQWGYGGGANQQFQIISLGNGELSIRARHTGFSLDIDGWSQAAGATVLGYSPSPVGHDAAGALRAAGARDVLAHMEKLWGVIGSPAWTRRFASSDQRSRSTVKSALSRSTSARTSGSMPSHPVGRSVVAAGVWVVLGVGIPACVWAWVSLTRAEGQEPLS